MRDRITQAIAGTSQLEEIESELDEVRRRLHRLAAAFAEEAWNARPESGRWSAAECVTHLSLTTEAFLPPIRGAIANARKSGLTAPGPFRQDVIGRILRWTLEPPVRFRVRTGAPFIPRTVGSRAEVLAELDALQGQLAGIVRSSDGVDIARVKVESPFARRLKYSLYSTFRIIPAHQRRHLWQIEQLSQGRIPPG